MQIIAKIKLHYIIRLMSTPNFPQDETELLLRIHQEYGTKESFVGLLRFREAEIRRLLGDLLQLGGKRILDIGSGSVTSPDQQGRMYEPWFARIAHEVGADVTAIDIGDLKGEKFQGIQADLSSPHLVLSQFLNEEFDLVNSEALVDTSNLAQTSASLLRTRTDAEIARLELELHAEVENLLKDSGVYLFNRTLFVKENGVLVSKGPIISFQKP